MEQDRITDKEFLIFIQFLIKKSIYTQAEIAKKLNITPPSLSRQLSEVSHGESAVLPAAPG